ncbi:hypothetical protein BMAGB8_A2225, partial [Burkholderia mallei GB8 horse 4]
MTNRPWRSLARQAAPAPRTRDGAAAWLRYARTTPRAGATPCLRRRPVRTGAAARAARRTGSVPTRYSP